MMGDKPIWDHELFLEVKDFTDVAQISVYNHYLFSEDALVGSFTL